MWRQRSDAKRRGPVDLAERWTSTGWRKSRGESVSVRDRDAVDVWLRELGDAGKQQVMIHRPWGTIAAVADRRGRLAVVMADSGHSWSAAAPGGKRGSELSRDQVRVVMTEALDSAHRPTCVDWQLII
jgi:hypothetical protein